jgi:hypothetical protein
MWLEWHINKAGYPEPCLLRLPSIYTGMQSWDVLRADLEKSAEKLSKASISLFVIHPTWPTLHFPAPVIECLKTKLANVNMKMGMLNLLQ